MVLVVLVSAGGSWLLSPYGVGVGAGGEYTYVCILDIAWRGASAALQFYLILLGARFISAENFQSNLKYHTFVPTL